MFKIIYYKKKKKKLNDNLLIEELNIQLKINLSNSVFYFKKLPQQ